jgi:hypothetical protein
VPAVTSLVGTATLLDLTRQVCQTDLPYRGVVTAAVQRISRGCRSTVLEHGHKYVLISFLDFDIAAFRTWNVGLHEI